MNILTVSGIYPSAQNPTYGTSISNFAARLSSLNKDGRNDVIAIRGRHRGLIAVTRAHLRFYRDLYRALKHDDYDVIYLHSLTHPIIPVRLALLSRRLPLVFNVHGDDAFPSNRYKRFLKRLARPVFKKAALIVAPTTYFAEVIKQQFPGVPESRIYISPSGGIDDFFFVDHKPADSDRPLTLGFISRIDNGKGWELFVEAMSQLRARNINCIGIVAGGGPATDEMLAMVKERGLDDVIVYRGRVKRNELPELYSSLDLFVFPSMLPESLGSVGLEAMAAGTPVVACNHAGPSTYVVDSHNGYLFEPGNLNSLVDRLLTFHRRSADTRRALSLNARATAERYRSSAVVPALYNRLSQI